MCRAILVGSVCLLTAVDAWGQVPGQLPPAGPLPVYDLSAPVGVSGTVPSVGVSGTVPSVGVSGTVPSAGVSGSAPVGTAGALPGAGVAGPRDGGPPAAVGASVPARGIPVDDPWAITGPNAYVSLDYLMWWYTPMNSVPLLVTVPTAFAVPNPPPGVTSTVFPVGNRISFNRGDGLRLNAGLNWQRWGVDVSAFYLERLSKAAGLANAGVPVAIGQPYVRAGTGGQTILYASLPNQYVGGVRVAAESQIWGAEVNARHAFYVFLADSSDVLTGLRYFALQESVTMFSPSFFPNGTALNVYDSFRSLNSFYGWQVGWNKRVGGGDAGWGLDVTTKSGIGGVHQRVDVYGANVFLAPGFPPDVEPGGLYARGLNLGSYSRNRFAFMQDLDIKLTYNFNPHVQVYAGYTLFYLSSVMRPTEAIDPVVNDGGIRYIANTTPSVLNRPNFIWKGTGFVVQGITLGLRLQY